MVNSITMFRVLAAPFLLFLLGKHFDVYFNVLLLVCFFTDLIDGFLARKFKVTSIFGTRLDSIGDDLTVLMALIGLIVRYPDFIRQQQIIFILVFSVFILQTVYALIKYKRITSFHTYLAKLAAILQGSFLLLFFFMGKPLMPLFYLAMGVTFFELIEEIILVYLLPTWEANVKGLYAYFSRK